MANSPSGDSLTGRIARVLESFTPSRTAQTVSEIGRRAGLPPSTAHRLVSEMIAEGLLERGDDKRVRVGLRLWELSTRSAGAMRLRQLAMPFMERVQARIREHTQLAVLENDEALFLERLSSPTSGANVTRIAGRLPLHASSSGVILAAYAGEEVQGRLLAGPLAALTSETPADPATLRRVMDDARRRGHVVAPGWIELVSTGVAVPVRDEAGGITAALSVVLPRDSGREAAALEELLAAAAGISRALAGARRT
ncbi:IclR family transcriptional regulator [Microterricola viridarii]|uniref:DNA-binding transcriptional regulator, IclR family n=1 Tax=Microterricola viridarii TaxID=412690 RepID=A0A1H1ZCV5_9MICO|nr:IclR family transcriptional regulator [Microterricola viridarii]SDT31528.1 DNA-binding transcriptional regulator, IclR family [Microterricola viridarii]